MSNHAQVTEMIRNFITGYEDPPARAAAATAEIFVVAGRIRLSGHSG